MTGLEKAKQTREKNRAARLKKAGITEKDIVSFTAARISYIRTRNA